MTWNKLSRRQQDYARRVAVPYVSGNSLRHTLRAARADAYIKAGFVEAGRTGGFAKLVHPGKNA